MLLKRAKIRAEIKAPEVAKEDQPFEVAVVLVNEGKTAAKDVRVNISCPDGEKELRLAEVSPQGGSAGVSALCKSATPGVNAVGVTVWYSDEKGRLYDPVTVSTKIVVHKRAPRLAGRVVPYATTALAGDAVEVVVEVVNDGDMSVMCTGEGVAEFSVPAGGQVSLKQLFVVREGVNIFGPLRFTCRDEKGRQYSFVTDTAEIRGVAKKPLLLTVKAAAPAEASGGSFPVEVTTQMRRWLGSYCYRPPGGVWRSRSQKRSHFLYPPTPLSGPGLTTYATYLHEMKSTRSRLLSPQWATSPF